VSTVTLAPSPATDAPVFHSPDDDPIERFRNQLRADLALSKLERDVQRREDHLHGTSAPRRTTVPRRSRRSAWTPSY
jgi:hypothetical protein